VFQEIVNRAQRSVDSLVSKYVTRMIVAIPFLIAVGFATAAATTKLANAYGTEIAYLTLAAGFAIVGLLAAASIAVAKEGNPSDQAASEESASIAASATQSDSDTLPGNLELLLPLLGTVGPIALPMAARVLFKNLPVILAAAVLIYLLFSDRAQHTGSVEPSAVPPTA
jgi:hypothetical protein